MKVKQGIILIALFLKTPINNHINVFISSINFTFVLYVGYGLNIRARGLKEQTFKPTQYGSICARGCSVCTRKSLDKPGRMRRPD